MIAPTRLNPNRFLMDIGKIGVAAAIAKTNEIYLPLIQ
jgi:hypothetical protein